MQILFFIVVYFPDVFVYLCLFRNGYLLSVTY